MGRELSAEPRSTRKDRDRPPELVEREQRRGSEVLLRHGHLHRENSGAGRVVSEGSAAVAGPGEREELGGSLGERKASGGGVEDAFPGGRDGGAQGRQIGRAHV